MQLKIPPRNITQVRRVFTSSLDCVHPLLAFGNPFPHYIFPQQSVALITRLLMCLIFGTQAACHNKFVCCTDDAGSETGAESSQRSLVMQSQHSVLLRR